MEKIYHAYRINNYIYDNCIIFGVHITNNDTIIIKILHCYHQFGKNIEIRIKEAKEIFPKQ